MVSRGVPDGWVASGRTVSVRNFPTTDDRRLTAVITSGDRSATLNCRPG